MLTRRFAAWSRRLASGVVGLLTEQGISITSVNIVALFRGDTFTGCSVVIDLLAGSAAAMIANEMHFNWSYQEWIDAMPQATPDFIRSFFTDAQPITVKGHDVFFAVMAEDYTPQAEQTEHAEAFLDLARKGDEQSFKDLARMTLQLTATEIDEMWAGTIKRLSP